jgi:hypothetical protein
MSSILYENGENKRARLKLKSSYQDHSKRCNKLLFIQRCKSHHSKLSNAAFVHQRAKKSHTNADIKKNSILVPNAKWKSPEEVCISATLADYNPPPKKKAKKNPSLIVNINEKVQQFYQQFPPGNGTHYDLKELVLGLLENSASPSIFRSPPIIIMCRCQVVDSFDRFDPSFRRPLVAAACGIVASNERHATATLDTHKKKQTFAACSFGSAS